MSALAVQEPAGEVGGGLGQGDGRRSEADVDRGAVDGDLVGGQPADPGDRLGIEQDEKTREAVPAADGVVVKQAAGGFPAAVLVEDLGGAVPAGGGEGQRGEPLAGAPSDEVSGVVAVGGLPAGQPSFEVGLAAGRKGQVLWCTTAYCWIVVAWPPVRRRSRRSRCQTA